MSEPGDWDHDDYGDCDAEWESMSEMDDESFMAELDRARATIAAQAARIKELEEDAEFMDGEANEYHERNATLTAERDALKQSVADYRAMMKDMFRNE